MSLSSFEEFEPELQNILNHFYKPFYHHEEQVIELLGIQPSQMSEVLSSIEKWSAREIICWRVIVLSILCPAHYGSPHTQQLSGGTFIVTC